MAPRVAGIPQYRERAALQTIKYRSWVPQTALHRAGEGTIAIMLRKGLDRAAARSWGESHNSVSQRRARLRLPPKFRPAPSRVKAGWRVALLHLICVKNPSPFGALWRGCYLVGFCDGRRVDCPPQVRKDAVECQE